MLSEPHYPSPRNVAVVFAVLLLLIAGVFVWAFVINFGHVEIEGSQPFSVEVDGRNFDCSSKSCTVDLPPRPYTFLALSKGFYNITFSIPVPRWQTVGKTLNFELVPYLKPRTEDLPAPVLAFRFEKDRTGKVSLVHDEAGKKNVVTIFDTLKNPTLEVKGKQAVIVDSGRTFLVDLTDGRKLRRFDDSVNVSEALLSDSGKTVLFAVHVHDQDQLWIYSIERSDLRTLSWQQAPEFLQWNPGEDHRLLIVTQDLDEEKSLLKKVQQTIPGTANPWKLLRYNLDTEKAEKILDFGEKTPKRFLRVEDRSIIEVESGEKEELIMK